MSGQMVDSRGRPLAEIELHSDAHSGRAVTDADGRFSMPDCRSSSVEIRLRSRGWAILSPKAKEHGTRFRLEGLTKAGREVRIVLGKDGVVTGTVRWDSGQPVKGFGVSGPSRSMVVCSPQGSFWLDGFPTGTHSFVVGTLQGVAWRKEVDMTPGGTVRVDPVLPTPTCTIRGTVRRPEGPARPDEAVTICASSHSSSEPTDGTCWHYGTRVHPDEEGKFRVRVPPGRYSLRTRAAGGPSGGKDAKTEVVVDRTRSVVDVWLTADGWRQTSQ